MWLNKDSTIWFDTLRKPYESYRTQITMSYWELCQMSGISANDPEGIDKLINMYGGDAPCCEYCDNDWNLIDFGDDIYICEECLDNGDEEE